MKILVLGGTRLLGRHIVGAALARGHSVTLFNRGQTDPGAFPGVEHVAGDRASDLGLLAGRTWDAVVDTSGYQPSQQRAAVDLFAPVVGRYAFISTISVYSDFSRMGLRKEDEGPVHEPRWEDGDLEGDGYGRMKVACEHVVRDAFGERALVVRPGLVVGPHDYMDRFPYWCRRVARGGEVLAPGSPDRQVQLIDARDLGEWLVRMLETDRGGTFNATGPAERLDMRGMLEAVREAVGGGAEFTWVPSDFLLERGVEEWREMPFWIRDDRGFLADVSRAVAAGLTFRPVAESARDVAAWEPTRPDEKRDCGLSPEREAELLREWKEMAGSA